MNGTTMLFAASGAAIAAPPAGALASIRKKGRNDLRIFASPSSPLHPGRMVLTGDPTRRRRESLSGLDRSPRQDDPGGQSGGLLVGAPGADARPAHRGDARREFRRRASKEVRGGAVQLGLGERNPRQAGVA